MQVLVWLVICYSEGMKYIIALGNPGTQYDGTRHNIGFAVARAVVSVAQLDPLRSSTRCHSLLTEGVWGGESVTIALPTTFMNNSGEAAAALVPKDKIGQLIVVHDEVALPLGKVRISVGGGAAGHNGIKSIIQALGTEDFIRVRLGVGSAPAGMPLERYVLGRSTPEEEAAVAALISGGVEALRLIVEKGVESAMNQLNG